MPTTPDRRPGPLEEDEEIRLTANPTTPSVAGAFLYDGSAFQFRDATGSFDPRTGGGVSQNDFGLESEPVTPNTTYTPTYTSGRVTEELWTKTTGGQAIRRVTYTYSGGRVSTEVRKIYAADGTTVVAQVTWSYTYTGGTVTGATMTRDV